MFSYVCFFPKKWINGTNSYPPRGRIEFKFSEKAENIEICRFQNTNYYIEQYTYLFSRKVLPLIKFLPMAVAFHAKYAPDGSHWKRYGFPSSHPHISKDTPNGLTPLQCTKAYKI